MNSYNSFSPEQRNAAQRWLDKEIAAGRLKRPTTCDACGQNKGVIDMHAEDYSDPPGPHLHAFSLCYVCHMVIHCRFGRGREAFEAYCTILEDGYRMQPFYNRDWNRFQRQALECEGAKLEKMAGPPARPMVRREIGWGNYNPRGARP